MKAQKVIWLCVFLVSCWSQLVFSQLYTFRNFNHKDGLKSSSILSLAEDNQGYIWLGSDGAGLIRFDGDVFDHDFGNSKRHVTSISFNEANELFFGTAYKGFYKVKYKAETEITGVEKVGQARLIRTLKESLLVVQDAVIQLFYQGELVDERKIFPLNEQLKLYTHKAIEDKLFLFTSRGNFVIHERRIENLNDWLGTSQDITADLVSISQKADSLVLISKTLNHELTVLLDNFRPKFFVREKLEPLLTEKEEVIKSATRFNFTIFLTNKGRLFKREANASTFTELLNSSGNLIVDPSDLIIDKNRDIWVATKRNGVFRISLEPFTQLNIHPVYEHPGIRLIHMTPESDVIVSNSDSLTYISNRYGKNEFVSYPLYTRSVTRHEGKNIVSHHKGLSEIKNARLEPLFEKEFKGRNISLVYSALGSLWVAEERVGLFRYDKVADAWIQVNGAPAYIYTAQESSDRNSVYFGSNVGVFKVERENINEIISLSTVINQIDLGYYVGNSTKDSHGNSWFTFDNGLLAIHQSGELSVIHEPVYFPSYLFYTLDADNNGNLIIGTNKGITVLAVSEDAKPIQSNTFDENNGFLGYETHTRASFKNENGEIFVGTLEGLFMIRPQFFQMKSPPSKPVITRVLNKSDVLALEQQENKVFSFDQNSFSFSFKSVNNKTDDIWYSYRLVGYNEDWSSWSKDKTAFYSGLPGGNYTFEVKASLNQDIISEITSYSFRIYVPFYRTRWFILGGIALVIILNLFLLEKTKKFKRKNIILSKDLATNKRMASSLLLFGALVNTGAHILASRIDDTIENHDLISIVTGVIVFTLFCLLTLTKRFSLKAGLFLTIGYFAILIQNFVGIYYSNIHPFYLTVILITLAVTPVVFRKLKAVIALALLTIITSFFIVNSVESPLFNDILFIIVIAAIALLIVLLTYIRNSSLEKLIFTSGVVNKGNALVVAFDEKGKVSYASENVYTVLNLPYNSLKGSYVSELNQFQPNTGEHDKFSNVDLKNEFEEGKIFVTPLFSKNNEIVYYQWSCKEFPGDVRVILGQDVTEKINLERYYELIVNNADDLIYQTDVTGKFTFVNDKCVESFKYDRSKIIGSSVDLLIHPSYLEEVQGFYQKQVEEKTRTTYVEFPIINGDNEVRWIGQNITSMFKPGTDNFITGYLGLARDITEKREVEALIKEQNKNIRDSINYARRIQFNMLPRSAAFDRFFKEHFVLFKPKDIVSGDFYWLDSLGDKVILICADCTGHGVPGSFMTLLGINILNQVILEGKITDPADILNELDQRLIDVLPRDGRNRVQDGMEITVCVFDHKNEIVEYAAAGSRFAVAYETKKDLVIVKADSKHIGDIQEVNYTYSKHSFTLSVDDTIYLFTDGYPDQFGGENNKKLTIKKFLALLNALKRQDLQEQNLIFQDHLEAWIGDNEQTDDITLIGIKGLRREK